MVLTLQLLAFGFGNLAMLGWLAAAAAPLLIHLWSRHRYREVDWAAIQFLLAAMRKNARRLQLQQWVLLAIRTLLIVLVVLAVAEPYGAGLNAGTSASTPTHKILVMDTSYSMAYADRATESHSTGVASATARFTRARELAAALVRGSSPADAFTVIEMSQPARTILGREVVDQEAVAERLESLRPTQTGADLNATLELVAEALGRNASDPRGLARQEVYIFTDLQQATWRTQHPDTGAKRANDRLAALTKQATVVIIGIGSPQSANIAVTHFATDESIVTTTRDAAFSATLREFGDQPRNSCVVEFLVDGQPVGEQTVDVPAGGDASVRFTHRINSPGSHALEIRAADDPLPLDNSRYLAVNVKDRVRVLCVAGRDGAAKYVASALCPDPAVNSAIEPIVVTEGDLDELELSDFDCIFLSNVAQLTAGETQRLTRYAAAGGGVVIFLGDRVIADQYNQLAAESAPLPVPEPSVADHIRNLQALLPVRIGSVTVSGKFGIDPLGYRHPIVAPFRGRERAGLLTTPVARYFKLEVPQDRPDIEVAAKLPGGDPLIVAAPLGRGRVVVIATDGSLTSVDPETGEPWTTWPTWPSFLPVVRELLAYASGGQQEQMQRPIGATLTGVLPPSAVATAQPLEIMRPDGRAEPLSIRRTPDGPYWSYDRTDVNGFYTLRRGASPADQHFAINVDTRESDLRQLDLATLPPEVLVRDTPAADTSAFATGLAPRSAWNLSLLWMALALVFLESFLAWKFGRGAA